MARAVTGKDIKFIYVMLLVIFGLIYIMSVNSKQVRLEGSRVQNPSSTEKQIKWLTFNLLPNEPHYRVSFQVDPIAYMLCCESDLGILSCSTPDKPGNGLRRDIEGSGWVWDASDSNEGCRLLIAFLG